MHDTFISVETEFERAFRIIDWEVRTCVPAAIRAFESIMRTGEPIEEFATMVEAIPAIIDASRLDFVDYLVDKIKAENEERSWVWCIAHRIKNTIMFAKQGHREGMPVTMLDFVNGLPDSVTVQPNGCELLRHLCTVTATE